METDTRNFGMQGTERRRLALAAVVVLVLLALFLGVKTIAEVKAMRFIGGGVPVSNTITVNGEGEAFAVPDVATFTFAVIEEASTVAVAQEAATEKTNEAIAYLEAQDIPEKNIKTVGYNVYPRYEYQQQICTEFGCPPGERELAGYEVSQTIEVRIEDTQKAGTILAGIGEIGVQNISGLHFTVDDEDSVQRDARQQAIADAKAKAEDLADDLGVTIVRVVDFSESGNGYYPRVSYEQSFDTAVSSGGATPPAPDVPTGENKVISNVSITYEIR